MSRKEPAEPPLDFSAGSASIAAAKAFLEKGGAAPVIRIALTKGRIEKKSALEILKACGYDVGELEAKGRKLIFRTGNLEIVLAKAADVITYIDRGVCDVGFVGSDTINEHGGEFL